MEYFLCFKTSDGEAFYTDTIAISEQTDPFMRRILLQWCKDRINQTPAGILSTDARAELMAAIDEMVEERSGLETAAAESGRVDPIDAAWLEEEERRAAGASAVSLPGDQFRALLGLAK